MKDSLLGRRILHMRHETRFLNREGLSEVDRSGFPENLRNCLGDPELACVVTRVVERTGECPLFRTLLAVLVYSYATGVYPSAEIVRLLRQTSRSIGFDDDEAALRRYRRHHLMQIKDCLAEVFATASATCVASKDCEGEAQERIMRAIREDSWALDF